MIIIKKQDQSAFFLQVFKRETGLNPTEHNILSAIHRVNVNLRQPFASMDDLVRESGSESDHLCKFINQLKVQEFIFCKPVEGDKRKRLYALTQTGLWKVQMSDYQLTEIEKTY